VVKFPCGTDIEAGDTTLWPPLHMGDGADFVRRFEDYEAKAEWLRSRARSASPQGHSFSPERKTWRRRKIRVVEDQLLTRRSRRLVEWPRCC